MLFFDLLFERKYYFGSCFEVYQSIMVGIISHDLLKEKN